jgi:hypothetical protein
MKVSLHTARVFSNPFYRAPVVLTDFVIPDNSPLTKTSVSLSPLGVIEYLTFVGLFLFTQENTISKFASFRIEAKFEPLSDQLQISIRFLLTPLPSMPSSSFAGILPVREHLGLTKFHIKDNIDALGAIFRPEIVCPFAIP